MIHLPKSKVLNIGISNFSPHQLSTLITETRLKPFVHQMELHPYLQQSAWVAKHKELGIHVTAYSPLGDTNPTYHSNEQGEQEEMIDTESAFLLDLNLDLDTDPFYPLLQNPILSQIARSKNCTPAQIALQWGFGRGTSVIPKSSHKDHILENFAAVTDPKCKLGYTDLRFLRFVGRKWLSRFNVPDWGVGLFEGLDGV